MLQVATADIAGGPHGAQGDVWQDCENDERNRTGEGKRRNEFAEWHVAWLVERHNYAEFFFYLMVLFVPAANKGKVTHGKTPRVFYIFSGLLHYNGSSWSDVKDL